MDREDLEKIVSILKDKDIENMKKDYNKRRRSMVLDCFKPLEAFYVFPSIQKTGLTTDKLVLNFLKEQKVAVVPDNAFGDCGERLIRCSYAYSIGSINETLKRIKKFISKYIREY